MGQVFDRRLADACRETRRKYRARHAGGTSGVGGGFAEAFRSFGNQVIIAGRRQSRRDEITADNPGMPGLPCDVQDSSAIDAFADHVRRKVPERNAVATFAAWLSAALTLAVWVMFAGFIARFTRTASPTNSLSAMPCPWLGPAIGAASGIPTGALVPALGHLALPSTVSRSSFSSPGCARTRSPAICSPGSLAW